MNEATDRRRSSRRSLNAIVPVHVGGHGGRLLDVSDIGLRFTVDWPAEDEIPSTATLLVGPQRVPVPVIVAWKVRDGDGPLMCGALVAAEGKGDWRRVLATLNVGPHEARRNFLVIEGGSSSDG